MLSLSKVLSALILLLATQAHASESYPSRPIRLVVPYPPGALTDNISRAFAVELGKVLDQTIIVENKPGASTVLGTQTAKQAPADGYTVLFAATALLTAIAGLNDPGYKLDDFTPVAVLGNIHFVLMIPSALPAETVSEFITYAGKHPGELNYAMIGIGGPGHILSERLKHAGKFKWESVPYKGGVQIFQALMANEVQGYFSTQNGAMTLKDSGKIRLLATAANERSEFLPDVPTFKELGYENITEENWSALFVRSQTPKEIVEKLRRASAQVVASEVMRDHLRNLGLSAYRGSVESFSVALPQELTQRTNDMKQLGITPQ